MSMRTRSVLLLSQPLRATRRGRFDDVFDTRAVLRTMELILGLKPMTQFDAAAMPMFNAFQAAPDTRPYEAEAARVNLEERNPKEGPGSRESAKMDFSHEDQVNDILLNDAIWRAVRGDKEAMPAPVHAAFVYSIPKSGDGDDD